MDQSPISRTSIPSLCCDDSTDTDMKMLDPDTPRPGAWYIERKQCSQNTSDVYSEFETAGHTLWMRDELDRYWDEVLTDDHERTISLFFSEPIPAARIEPTQSGQLKSTNPMSLPNAQSCTPDRLGRKRKACSAELKKPIKRTKLKQADAILSEEGGQGTGREVAEEVVFLRLEKVFLTIDMDVHEFRWARRISSWVEVDQEMMDRKDVEIDWLFERCNRKFLSVEVRTDGVGYTVELTWDDKEQCFFGGEAVGGKTITVSEKVVQDMRKDPLHGQFEGKRRDMAKS